MDVVAVKPLAVLPKPKPKVVEDKKRKLSPGASLTAGAIAGAVEASLTYPFEFAKTRVQLHATPGARNPNPFQVIALVVRNDGVRALYTGCSTLILGTAFKAGVRFLSYDSIKNRLADEHGKLSASRGMLAGMCAGLVESVVAVAPTERIKTALIDDARSAKRFRGGFDAARTIISERGVAEIYRGLTSTAIKQSATSAVRMGSYNVLKEAASRYHLPNSSGVTFGMGALAGVVTVYATQPFDTIKTRTQSAKGAGMKEAVREVIGSSGVKGLWSGSTMRLGRLVFSGGIVFTVYEAVADVLRR